jgi:PhzF family phenazine biosynthesis protein
MKIKIYQVDAFAEKVFTGNPAAVCPLDTWLPDATMQNIAMENNLAETAFYVKKEEGYELRWFTPNTEVDLCGHATLAAAFVLFNYENHAGDTVYFHSLRSGQLSVSRNGELLTLDFPADVYNPVEPATLPAACFNLPPLEAYKGKTDYMLVYENETQIKNIIPNLPAIAQLDARGVIVTAPGDGVDFVSRFFAPQCGVNEDPVTGSAHTTLTPYWAKRLGKVHLTALQLSARQGHLQCHYLVERVQISGKAKMYLKGEIIIED